MKFQVLPVEDLEGVTRDLEQIQGWNVFFDRGDPAFVAPGGSYYFNQRPGAAALHRIWFNTADGSHWTGIV